MSGEKSLFLSLSLGGSQGYMLVPLGINYRNMKVTHPDCGEDRTLGYTAQKKLPQRETSDKKPPRRGVPEKGPGGMELFKISFLAGHSGAHL